MKKIVLFLGVVVVQSSFAQVGISTEFPKATLDVAAKPNDITKTDGFIAPRLTGNELKAKDLLYGTDQVGAIVYATAAASPVTLKTINVVTTGYYYFNGNVWIGLADTSTENGNYIEPWYDSAINKAATKNTQDIYQMGKVGIGASSAVTKLDVRGSIRGGSPNAEEINGSSPVGSNSIAVGNNNKVSGVRSAAFGDSNTVTGPGNIVAGNSNTTGGSYNGIFGIQNNVEGVRSLISGADNIVSGNATAYNLVTGLNNNLSPIAGITNTVGNMVGGNGNQIQNDYSIVNGSQNIIHGDYNIINGSTNSTDQTSSSVFATGFQNIANNSSYVGLLGSKNTLIDANLSLVVGTNNKVSSPTAFVSGANNIVNTDAGYATVFGLNNTIGGNGTINYATSIGTRNTSKGHVSTTIGSDLMANSFSEIVLGRWNEIASTSNPSNWIGTDPILQVGIGTSDTAKKNALTIYKDGKVQVNQLKGTGNAFACIDADGNLFRSTTPCTP
ncbi:hypothetical protein ACM40_10695 [Chryseobacterium sp. BLS98]|uniref:hypothetical protein n=1 Tax=Chryseobacterium sp. BLS98 TaxID=885586 RepID=UPI00065A976B|nr:hypothetical protein [Chryseobacterium sp. BLS98]KMQ62719.1 hypothetical protein ACM40_10695 [Chryseobacterium sp. BLS98]